jgi:O-antigen/teichoic acid export membrane protein
VTAVHSPEKFSLKRRILSAGSWSLAGNALGYPIRLGSNLLLTRLLVPEMFGVMAIAMLVMTGLTMFSDLGLSQNIVQSKRGSDPTYLNTAWAIQIARGLLLWLLALCIAMLVAAANWYGLVPSSSVYADPYLPYVIAAVAFSAVIGGFNSTKTAEASRNLSLGRVVQIQLVSQIAGLICMIGWVLIDRSIWALVAGSLVSTALVMLLSHVWLPGTANRWHWDQSAFHEIFHFGKWMFLSSILGFFANNADRMLLGGYVNATMLGIYSIAFTFSGSITQILNTIFSQVSYPALSEVARERPSGLKRNLYRFHTLSASLTYFCAGGLLVSGDKLIHLLYDPRYVQAGWMLQVLAIGLLSLPFNLAQFCLLGHGFPKIFTTVIAVRMGITILLIPLGFHFFGLPGAVWAIAISQLSSAPATIYYQIKHGLFDLSKELLLLPIFFAGMIVAEGFNLAIGR